jgi:pimeloyl-ACP methyl ester carboxylesterase
MTRQHFTVEPGVELNLEIDDYTDPWSQAETILMVHGLAESTLAWRGWVPHLARRYRVARLDLRGFGHSTPMRADYAWSMDRLLADLAAVIGYLGCKKVHLVGAKSGGSMVLTMAARRPELVRSVVAVTPPVIAAAGTTDWLKQIEAEGVEAWAKSTMTGRLGSNAPAAEVDYWVRNIQGKTPLSTLQGYLRWVPGLDIREEVQKITCPSLIITTTGSGLRTVDSVKAWQQKLALSELLVIDGDAWHAAGAYPDVCAKAAAEFLARVRAG